MARAQRAAARLWVVGGAPPAEAEGARLAEPRGVAEAPVAEGAPAADRWALQRRAARRRADALSAESVHRRHLPGADARRQHDHRAPSRVSSFW